MPETERKSRWKLAVCYVPLVLVLYWMSAPVSLWVWEHHGPPSRIDPRGWHPFYSAPEWWRNAYEPVLWAAEQPSLRGVTMKPFEWGGIERFVELELLNRQVVREETAP